MPQKVQHSGRQHIGCCPRRTILCIFHALFSRVNLCHQCSQFWRTPDHLQQSFQGRFDKRLLLINIVRQSLFLFAPGLLPLFDARESGLMDTHFVRECNLSEPLSLPRNSQTVTKISTLSLLVMHIYAYTMQFEMRKVP